MRETYGDGAECPHCRMPIAPPEPKTLGERVAGYLMMKELEKAGLVKRKSP